jgi:hypothetical protein
MEVAETFSPVPGFTDYEASSSGYIRRRTQGRRHPAGHVLKPWLAGESPGYLYVDLRQDGKRLKTGIHRLVALSFHGEPPTKEHEAGHLDGKRLNNAAGNLAWLTHSENEKQKKAHGTAHDPGMFGEAHPMAKLTDAAVRQIRVSDAPTGSLSAQFGVSPSTIRRAKRADSWAHAR